MRRMFAIETRDLCKSYKNKQAVADLNLSVYEGELFALLGVNGAGKTTTIKMLTGLVRPTKGDALLCGHSILSQLQEVKQLTNVSPQETAVAPCLTVRENLALVAGIYGCTKAETAARVDAMLAQFSMQEVAGQRAKTLSGGWQRRLSIAMALITQPKILFLDEPTLGLDVLARRELWSIIEQLKGRTTIVLTTHYLEEAQALSDRIGIMANGCLRAVGTAEELKAQTGAASFEDAFVALARKGGAAQ